MTLPRLPGICRLAALTLALAAILSLTLAAAAGAAKVARLPGVVRVERDRLVHIQGLGAPSPLSVADRRTTGRTASGLHTLVPPSILLLVTLWGATRRRRQWSAL
jgi:hypothetical protein